MAEDRYREQQTAAALFDQERETKVTHGLLALLLLSSLLGQLGLQVALLARGSGGDGRGRGSLLGRLVGGGGVPVVLKAGGREVEDSLEVSFRRAGELEHTTSSERLAEREQLAWRRTCHDEARTPAGRTSESAFCSTSSSAKRLLRGRTTGAGVAATLVGSSSLCSTSRARGRGSEEGRRRQTFGPSACVRSVQSSED